MVVGHTAQMSSATPGAWTASVHTTMLEHPGMMPYGSSVSGVSSSIVPVTLCWCVPAPGNRVMQLHEGASMGFWMPAPPVGLDQRWLNTGASGESLPSLPVLSVSVDGDVAEITFQDFASAWAAAVDLDRKSLPELEATLCVQLADSCLPTAEDLLRCLAAIEGNAKRGNAQGIEVKKDVKSHCSESSSSITSCVVCQDAARCIVFEPCKHLVCCAACGGRADPDIPTLHRCPVCRAEILRRLEVYVS